MLTSQNISLLTQAREKELVTELSFCGTGQIDGEGDKSGLYFYYDEWLKLIVAGVVPVRRHAAGVF